MIEKLLRDIEEAEHKELDRALRDHGEFSGRLEGWAKLLEEIEEAADELIAAFEGVMELKESVLHGSMSDSNERELLSKIHRRSQCGAAELIQVAAMATKFRRLYR